MPRTRQCNGVTRQGRQCLRRVRVAKAAQLLVYCAVHKSQRHNHQPPPSDNTALSTSAADDVLFECQCCFCECFLRDRVTCGNGHQFCRECVCRWVAEKIAAGNTEIYCLAATASAAPTPTVTDNDTKTGTTENKDGGCRAPLNPEMLRRVVPKGQYKAWNDRQCHDAISAAFAPSLAAATPINKDAETNDLRTCPKCRFYCVLMDASAADRNRNLLSCLHDECKFRSCLHCQQAYHAGAATCQTSPEEAAATAAKTDLRRSVEEILTRHRVRRCPNGGCGNIFVRTDGCNKMKCSRCGSLSCYRCRQLIRGYDHFRSRQQDEQQQRPIKCELFTNEDNIEQLAVRDAAAQVWDQYGKTAQKDDAHRLLKQLAHEHPEHVHVAIDQLFGVHKKNDAGCWRCVIL